MNTHIKKTFLAIIILICLPIEAVSQRRIPEDGSPRRRNQIYVPLSGQSQLIIAFNHWHELQAHSNIDSLLHVFLNDWKMYKASALSFFFHIQQDFVYH